MRLSGWHIGGFGALSDWRHDGLSDGLTIFYGPNEAGKSTLLAFLRFALFGFKGGNSKELKYVPPPGVAHGGTLLVRNDDSEGVWTIERLVTAGRGAKKLRIEAPDGSDREDAELSQLLGTADRDLFNNVFAFSLSELQSIESLTAKGVQDHIFSAGITGAGRSARDALTQISKESDGLFKGKARCVVNDLIDELADFDKSLREQRERARGYPELLAREQELAATHEALRLREDERRASGLRARKLNELWRDIYGPLLADKQTLEGLPAAVAFGPEPRKKLEEAVSKTTQLVAAQREVAGDVERSKEKLARFFPDTAALGLREAVEKLNRDLGLYENRCKDVPLQSQALALLDKGLETALSALGTDWTTERLKGFHFSVSKVSDATRWAERLHQSRERVRELEHKLRTSDEQLDKAHASLAEEVELRDEIQAPTTGELDERTAQLRALRDCLLKRERLEAQLLGLLKLIAVESGALAAPGSASLRRSLGLGTSAVGAVLLGVLFVSNDFSLVVDAGFIVSMALFAVGALGAVLSKAESNADVDRSDEQRALESDIAQLAADELRLASLAGLAGGTCAENIDAAELEINRARTLRALIENHETHIERAKRAIASLEGSEKQLTTEAEKVNQGHVATTSDWEQWREAAGLPDQLAPQDTTVFTGEVQRAKKQLEALTAARLKIEGLKRQIGEWETNARALLAESGEAVPQTDDDANGNANVNANGDALLVEKFVQLVKRCHDAQRSEDERPGVQEEHEALVGKALLGENDLAAANEEITALLARVDAVDRDDYLEKLDQYEARRDLVSKVGAREEELDRRLGLGDEASELRRELTHGRVSEWEREAASADGEVATLKVQCDEALRAHQDAHNEKEDLEGSDGVSALELARSGLEEELACAVARWRKLQVARGLIERTLERFEKERQPSVLKEASHHFSKVTGGRYPQIVQTAELGGFSVVDAAGKRKSPEELSRGTAEQLYVCIRLGLVAEFTRRAGRLPIAMDDVLVNFDDQRAFAMAQVLADFSHRNGCQVLVFTCSSRTKELFASAAPDAKLCEFAAPAAIPPRSPLDGPPEHSRITD